MKKHSLVIILIFCLAVIVRFVYFPHNVYFSYDQARDFYFAGDILKGDIRLIGPPSAAGDKLFAGPLSLYIYAIIQFLFGKSPVAYSIFFRLYNAAGVFFVYLIGVNLFNKKVGILSAFMYAISYEQSQYALMMSHQPLAVITMLIYYLGLTYLLFKKKREGLILAALGLGLSIQFHFVYLFILPAVFAIAYLFIKRLNILNIKYVIFSLGLFLLTTGTYLISELKFNAKFTLAMLESSHTAGIHINEAMFAAKRFVHDFLYADYRLSGFILILIISVFIFNIVKKSKVRMNFVLLLLWIISGLLPYLISGNRGYYYSAAGSVSLIILFAYFISVFHKKSMLFSAAILMLIIVNNVGLIKNHNIDGPNLDMVIQPGMLLLKEIETLNYIYHSSSDSPFSVNALTVPLNVNTTWSYLFEWYGLSKYGYIPIWSTKPAEGYPGSMEYETSRSELPDAQYVIIEPLNGIPVTEIAKFKANEGYFSEIIEEKEFGNIVVQKRAKIDKQ